MTPLWYFLLYCAAYPIGIVAIVFNGMEWGPRFGDPSCFIVAWALVLPFVMYWTIL